MQIRDYLKDGHLIEGTELCEETQTLEYKIYKYPFPQERLNLIYSLYSAWLNTTGGVLFIGVINDSCQVKGLSLTKSDVALCKELLSLEKANIIPSPPKDCFRMTFIPVKGQENQEKYVIRIEVIHGDKTTYYGRDTGHFNYIRMNQWNEKEDKFEKVKLKLHHVERLDDDINNLHNQPKFDFDNSYDFPEIKTEKLSEEVINQTLDNQRQVLGKKLKNVLEKRLRGGSFGYLNDLLGSVENPDIYHIQNIWNGLKGVEELQDTIIRKLEKMISTSEPSSKVEETTEPKDQADKSKAEISTEKPLDKLKVENSEEKKTNSVVNLVLERSSEKREESNKAQEQQKVLSTAATVTAITKEVEKAIDNISRSSSENQTNNTAVSSNKIQDHKYTVPNNAMLQQSLMAALNIMPMSKEVEETKNNNSNKQNNQGYKQRPESSNHSSSVKARDEESRTHPPRNGEGLRQQNSNGNTGNHKKKRNGWQKKQKEQNGQGGQGGQKAENKQNGQREVVQNIYVPKSNSKQQ